MIDPVIFSFELFGTTLTLRWYGVIVMIGVVVGSLMVERWLKRYGEKSDRIWDALIWVLPIGIIGARLWYVMNATLGGNRSYLENPASIIRVWEGGLHIFGGFLLGALALLLYLRQNKLDPWLFLDAAGPAALVGQGIGRIANFINQELYGPPTDLPWGIPISAEHRLPQFQNLSAATRFHPTFAYEMLWNFASAGLLLWLSRRYEKDVKPGTMFGGWLVLAGIGRVIIEFFRPDQPKIEGLGLSYSAIFAALMAIAGAVVLMIRYRAVNPAFAEDWEEEYQISGEVKPSKETAEVEELDEAEVPAVVDAEWETPRSRRTSPAKEASSARVKKPAGKSSVRKTTKKPESAPRKPRAKKSSE
jgi:phosphatidylglycerol:prolipoprotein diacylglycerol transferase